MPARGYQKIAAEILNDLPEILRDVQVPATTSSSSKEPFNIRDSIERRSESIHRQVVETMKSRQQEIELATAAFLRWMTEGTAVRILGAGRARLAAAIPANRLAHGGARVYVQDDIVPMPHTIKGGGIIAASASGQTKSVLDALRVAKSESRDIQVVGIASSSAQEFKGYCDIFIGLASESPDAVNPLRALADSEEYVISLLLDAMVVAAGRLGGFVDTLWRIGHENIGPSGPYDHNRRKE